MWCKDKLTVQQSQDSCTKYFIEVVYKASKYNFAKVKEEVAAEWPGAVKTKWRRFYYLPDWKITDSSLAEIAKFNEMILRKNCKK
jgi:hypothetical protein